MGYIAKSVSLAGKGKKHEAYRACDIAFGNSHSTHVGFLLLIKAVVVCMAGDHEDAISRMDDLIATVNLNSICYVVQAYMRLLSGNSSMENGDYEGAIQLFEVARDKLRHHTSQGLSLVSLISGWNFDDLDITIRLHLCQALYAAGRTSNAGEVSLNIINGVDEEVFMRESIIVLVCTLLYQYLTTPESGGNASSQAPGDNIKQQLSQKLERIGDMAMDTGRHDDAIRVYSNLLSLNSESPQGLFVKRSKAYVAKGAWENGLNEAIGLDPSSPWGYERRHAALHGAGCYDNAISAFETMLFRMTQSLDSNIRERQREYVNPALTKAAIREIVQDTIRNSPRVLIHTISGRLFDKTRQALLFETLPVFKELISATTTHIDHARIQREVSQYYRYATFSHTWEDNDEPLFEEVVQIIVYDIEGSFTRNKLQMFCKIAREAGFYWAWSDTCCINKADHFVLQEALVAMFKWYAGSAITIVFLRGVHSPSQPGGLMRSIWNTRGWTFQEYHASKVVRFYTEKWQPYLNPDIPNHKDSPEIIAEMERATGVAAQLLVDLQPGSHDIREKLCLASRRETRFVEDAAYSLLGIFSVSLPIVYGEGDHALGRLLAQLLTSSGDTSILAWTGKSGSFNSCLPASITVFSELPTSHIPPAITGAEMEISTARMRTPSSKIMDLYDRLQGLSVPSLVTQRIKLPCLTFKLGPISATRSASGYVFRAKAGGLRNVNIKTAEDLTRLDSLTLVHPWIDFLLDRQPIDSITETLTENTNYQSSPTDTPSLPSGPSNTPRTFGQMRTLFAGLVLPSGAGDTASLLSPSPMSPADKQLKALEFISRLRRPFGALLFTPTRKNVEEYRRVAPERSRLRISRQRY